LKLRSLTLENFRQFYGRQTLVFAQRDDANVTVVYGANGAGKTTLLAAFTWVLYGQFPPAFENPEHLINERLVAESSDDMELPARVQLQFEDQDRLYTVERSCTYRKNGSALNLLREPMISVQYVADDGREFRERENPTDAINQILPERLHRFFFFDGERIEQLVKPQAYAEIEQAIKNVLGLEIIERAIRHLTGAQKNLDAEYRDVAPPSGKQVQDAITKIEAAIEENRARLQEVRLNKEALEDERRTVDERLRTLEDTRSLQERREELEAELQNNKTAMAQRHLALAAVIGQRGYLAFSEELAQSTRQQVQEHRQRGEIPSGIKRQFVEDLLSAGCCICGTLLIPGDDPHRCVEEWRSRAGLPEVEEAWIRLAAQADEMLLTRGDLYREIRSYKAELVRLESLHTSISERLSEVVAQLGDKGKQSEEIGTLEARREQLQQDISECDRETGRIEQQFTDLEREKSNKEKERAAVQAADARAKLALRRADVAREAKQVFERILQIRTEDVRKQLDDRVKKNYSAISYKPYIPELGPDFRLQLVKPVGSIDEAVAKSTGENQILSLSFVGAIADLARERYRDLRAANAATSQLLSYQGGIYPIVMDSPFGTLDDNYRRQVADAIPRLAPQVVVFVSKSQGLGPVQNELGPRTGRRYVIRYFTPKIDTVDEFIDLDGNEHLYIETTQQPFEWAELREV
jgi:DNA sulfur modification protein DndD